MRYLTMEQIGAYEVMLVKEERSRGTVGKYLRDVKGFFCWLDGREVTKEVVVAWKEWLLSSRKAVTVNSMLAAVNGLLEFLGWADCKVKALRVQKEAFRSKAKEMSVEDYERLVEEARRRGKKRLALLIEAMGGTGIRASEVKYLTVEAVGQGAAVVSLKGKVRTILIPRKLAKKLLKYAEGKGITEGEIFITRTGRSLGRKQIWAEMKALCAAAGVEKSKVYPHNLRHLFARTFYKACKDVAKLADVLGHSSINTTRIYLISTGEEHLRELERLGLVS